MSASLTAEMIDQALYERLAQIRRTLPPERQDSAALEAHFMADHLHAVLRSQWVPRCEVSADGRSFRCY